MFYWTEDTASTCTCMAVGAWAAVPMLRMQLSSAITVEVDTSAALHTMSKDTVVFAQPT